MNKPCLKQTSIPGTSQLFSDYLYHFDRVSGYYDWDPFSHQSFFGAAAQIQFPVERRKAIASALKKQNPGNENLAILERDNSVAVVTGQQVGLFSGPAYTVYKAVTAARLAKKLQSEGLPAVPVFWLATEDHDLAEVDHAWIFDSGFKPAKLHAKVRETGGPVGRAVLEDVPLAELERSFEGFPYAAEILDLVRESYRPGATLGSAFLDLVRKLLQPLGLVFLDPLEAGFREIVAPLLAEMARKTPDILTAVQQRSKELEQAGYHAQVHVDAQTSPLFLLDGARRVSFKFRDGKFANKQASYTAADLQARAADISPNALLRPVMQDYALPTVAYVGGPAEVAYMAQCQPVYHILLGRMPVIVPRNGFTLLDDRTIKLMHRYDVEMEDVLCNQEQLQSRIASRLVPASVKDTLSSAQNVVSKELSRVEEALSCFDPTLQAALQKSAAKIRYQLDKIARKTARETFRRNEQAQQAAEHLQNAIYPHQHLQERMYTILPFLAQHGTELISRLFDAAQLECPDHMPRSVSDLSALVYSN